jgi:hypothetical protein
VSNLRPEPSTGATESVEIFFSYSHKDESLRKGLEDHLSVIRRQGIISGWHDRMIGPGQEWKGEIDRRLDSARIILLLISPSFLASDYCWDVEMKRAIERHERAEATVIPVILRPCDWHGAPFGKLQALPKDAKPVTSWRPQDEAFKNIAEGIRAVAGCKGNPLPAAKPKDSSAKTKECPTDLVTGDTVGETESVAANFSREQGQVADSSGMWVVVDNRFFEAESVDEKGGTIDIVAASESAAVDAAIKSLRTPLHGSPRAIGYSHGNDATIVRVKDIDSRTESGKKRWFIKLVKEDVAFGGHPMEAVVETRTGRLSPTEVATLRATRILLNDPPSVPVLYSPGGDLAKSIEDGLVEAHIEGIDNALKITSSGIKEICSNQTIPLHQRLQMARLMALFQLVVGNVVEHVNHLAVGPVSGNKVHVEFRGMRRKVYANVEPIEIRVEGDCSLF